MLRMAVPAGYARVTFTYDAEGYTGPMSNTVAFETATALDGPIVNSPEWLARAPWFYAEWWKASIAEVMSTGSVDMSLVRVETSENVVEGHSPTGPYTGSHPTGAVSIPELATVVSFRGANPGRSNRGRIYVPGMPTSFYSSAGLTVDGINALADLVAGTAAFYGDLPLELAGEPMTTGGVVILHPAGGTPTPVTTIKLGARAGHLRSRQR